MSYVERETDLCLSSHLSVSCCVFGVCLSLPLCGVVCLCIAVSRVSLYRERCLSIRRSNSVPLESLFVTRFVAMSLYRAVAWLRMTIRHTIRRSNCLSLYIRHKSLRRSNDYSSHHSSLQQIVTRPLYRETHARQEYRCRSNSVSLHWLLASTILIASRMYSVSLLLFRVKCVCVLLSRVKCDCVQQRL